jgi:hypothetical protein
MAAVTSITDPEGKQNRSSMLAPLYIPSSCILEQYGAGSASVFSDWSEEAVEKFDGGNIPERRDKHRIHQRWLI